MSVNCHTGLLCPALSQRGKAWDGPRVMEPIQSGKARAKVHATARVPCLVLRAEAKWLASACLLVTLWHAQVHADLDSDAPYLDPKLVAQCRRALKTPPPPADLPQSADRARLAACDSTALYYGIGQNKDVRDARLCAYLEIEEQRDHALGGGQVLTPIYANAEGVARNPELARRYACAGYMARGELQNLLARIATLEANPSAAPLVYCDEMTSSYMTGACADLADRDAALARTARAATALGTLKQPAQRRAWKALSKALERFAQEHADNEVDLSGSARGAYMVQAEAEVSEEFTRLLELFAVGQTPKDFGSQPLAAAERALSAAFRAGTAVPVTDSSITAEGVQIAQRAWLAYRNAWLAFARVRFPSLSSDALSSWLAQRRTRQLGTLGALPGSDSPAL